MGMPLRCKQAFPREEKCLLDLPQSVLQFHFFLKKLKVAACALK
jgi:hypothetical protein